MQNKFHKKPLSLVISGLVVTTGTMLVLPRLAYAAQIEEVLVEDSQQNLRLDQSSLSKLTEPLRDTPQSISTITAQTLDDRAVMSLTDALRNVPGITLGAGEFSWQGNSPNIRGFSSRNDMFLDGMRDFGNYERDPFDLESVEVMLGPSSMEFGRGSTGGVINQTSKQALPDPLRSLHVNVGNAGTRRAVLDVNQPINDRAALRVNLLDHTSGVPGRNGAESNRKGLATSLSMELGSATQLSLNFIKQTGDSTPDYGLPWYNGKPAPVSRENYYGFDSDFMKTDAQISTAKLVHEFNRDLRLETQLRYADYYRSTRITEPQIPASSAGQALADIRIDRKVFRGESEERMAMAQVNLLANAMTGMVEHHLVLGLEGGSESSSPDFGFPLGVPQTSLLAPVDDGFSSTGTAWRLRSDSQADSLAAFVLDTAKFNDKWQLMAGLRWDSFDIDYRAQRFDDSGAFLSNEHIPRKDTKLSWRAALVYKPVERGTFYVGTGTSFNPSAEGLSFINSGRNLTIGNAYLEPETTRSLEAGTKWEMLEDTLYMDAAVFHIVKNNARVPDPNNPGFNILAGEEKVNGLSVNVSGRLGDGLSLNAGYTYMDSEEGQTTQATVLPGTPLANVPDNSLSLWLSWQPGMHWELAGGARYVGRRLATIAQPVKEVPGYTALDAMLKYQLNEHVTFKLNLTNLGDKYYFEQLHPWHVIPGPGFGSVFAVNVDY